MKTRKYCATLAVLALLAACGDDASDAESEDDHVEFAVVEGGDEDHAGARG